MATTYRPHVLLQIFGRLGGSAGVEVWSCGIRLHNASDALPTRAQLVTALDAMQPLIGNWFTSSDSYISQSGFLTGAKLNAILASGKQREQDTVEIEWASAPQGARPVLAPFYQSWALTWRTALRRGRGHSGRIYPPVVSALMEESGYCSLASSNQMAASGALLLSNVNSQLSLAAGAPYRASVMSAGNDGAGGAPVVLPASQIITGVTVDRVPDVQHRRTRQLLRSESNLVSVSGG